MPIGDRRLVVCQDLPLGPPPGSDALLTHLVAESSADQDAVVALDADFTVTFWSSGAEQLYGISADTALGRQFSDLVTGHPLPPGRQERTGLTCGRAMHVVNAGRRTVAVQVTLVAGARKRDGE